MSKHLFAFALAFFFVADAGAANIIVGPTMPSAALVAKLQPMPLGDQLPVEIVFNQQELGVDVSTTGAAVTGAVIGGLVGGLISAGIANAQVKAAEERVVPLRDAMLAYDFNRSVEAELRAKLPSEGIATNPVITAMPTAWHLVDAQNANQLPKHAMVIYPRYAIDSKFARLRVQLQVQIVDRKVSSSGKVKSKPSFGRVYAFNYDIEDGKVEDNIAQWTTLGGSRMAALVDRGVVQVVDMLVHDFSTQGRSEWKRTTNKQSVKFKNKRYSGFSVREADEYVWVRSGTKTQFFEGFQPIDVDALKTAVSIAPQGAADATPKLDANAAEAKAAETSAPTGTTDGATQSATDGETEDAADGAMGDDSKTDTPKSP